VTPNIEVFWKLIAESQLLNEEQIQREASQWSGRNAATVCQQLIDGGFITGLHRDVILAGHSGPFVYGRYLVTDQLWKTNDQSTDGKATWHAFAGKDRRTGHPVQLTFYQNDAKGAVERWRQIEKRVRRLAKCRHRHLFQTYQSIVLPEFRFVVSELPVGVRLSEALPRKGRLTLEEAASVALQMAQAIAAQMDAGCEPWLPADSAMLNRVWLGTKEAKGSAKYQPEFDAQLRSELSPEFKNHDSVSAIDYANHRSPVKSVAGLMMRMAGGAFVANDNLQKLVEKSGISGELKTVVETVLGEVDHESAPKNTDGDRLRNLIKALQSVSGEVSPPVTLATAEAFRKVLSGSQLLTPTVKKSIVESPQIKVPENTDDLRASVGSSSNDPRILAARQSAVMRKRNRWKTPAAVALTLLLLAAGFLTWARLSNPVFVAPGNLSVEQPFAIEVAEVDSKPTPQSSAESTDQSIVAGSGDFLRPDFSNVAYVQEIVDDDNQRLWESPTTGRAIDFQYVPDRTQILLHVEVADLLASPPGQRLVAGLSSVFGQATKNLQNRIGVTAQQIEAITIAMFPANDQRYDFVCCATVNHGVSIRQLTDLWGDPDEIKTSSGKTIYSGQQWAYLIVDANTDGDGLSDVGNIRFVAGPAPVVQEMERRNGNSILPPPLQRLAGRSDRDRHLTLIATPKSITDRLGRDLWGAAAGTIVPELKVLFPDEVRGVSLGLHVDGGNYWEMQVDHSLDLSAKDLQNKLSSRVDNSLVQAAEFASTLQSLDYWNPVRQRIEPMTRQLASQLRWDVEFGNVIANAWMPTDAAHNLVAAAELTLALADTAEAVKGNANPLTPQTLEELLRTPRSLNVANPPDLNILMSQLADDVNDDFPNLPFQLKISLKGNDLQKEGITQNQRPGPLAFEAVSLADILTQIMTSANPNKNISGPNDPACKLVWVVVKDDNPEVATIAITTRSAAAARGDVLPPAFVISQP
jgi:hypothetical protein